MERQEANGDTERRSDRGRHLHGHAKPLAHDCERRAEQRGYRIEFGAQDCRDLHHEHVANDPAADSCHHAEQRGGNGPSVKCERLVRAATQNRASPAASNSSTGLRNRLMSGSAKKAIAPAKMETAR